LISQTALARCKRSRTPSHSNASGGVSTQISLTPGSFPHAQVQRASEIEWDAATRHWAVHITVPGQPTRATVFAHALRHVCVQWEVNHVNAILRALD
jgi:hypothetical protein